MRRLELFALVAAMGCFAGCAAYHLGPVNGAAAGAKAIEILPFNNQTLQPRLGDAVTRALRERFQADGTYLIATHEPGDIVVSGVITRYNREGLSYLNNDVTTTENYRVSVIAHVVVRERATGKLLFEKDVNGYTLIHVGTDLADSERQSLPLLAADLARNITTLITEGAW
jgi:hypothetical protein